MHHNLRLTPLLALALASACGGKGEQSVGGLEGLAQEDQRPPRDQQQAPPSSDRPPASEEPNREDSCESVCDAAQARCTVPNCQRSCREGSAEFPQCQSNWVAVLWCVVGNDLVCGGNAGSGEILERCASEYTAYYRCAGLLGGQEEEEEASVQ